MIINSAILRIKDSAYNVLRFRQRFERNIDTRGRPCSNYYGGEIAVVLESTDNIRLFQQMIHKDMQTVDGSIELLSGTDQTCIRRIEFKEAYIYSYGENLQCGSCLPMTTTIEISPMRLDYNDNMLRLDRLWPRAPQGWQKYVEEVKSVRAETTPNIRITDAYWINENGDQIRELITNDEITLYIVLEEYTAGQTIRLTFEDSNKKGVYRADCSGTVHEDGLLVIEDFKMVKQ